MHEIFIGTVDGCEILHHQKDGWNPINSGINLSTGARFLNHPQYVFQKPDIFASVFQSDSKMGMYTYSYGGMIIPRHG